MGYFANQMAEDLFRMLRGKVKLEMSKRTERRDGKQAEKSAGSKNSGNAKK